MAYIYPIKPTSSDSHQVDPYWIAAIVPFTDKATASKAELAVHDWKSNGNKTLDDVSLISDPVKTDDLIILDNECTRWQTRASKESHVSSLNLTLHPGFAKKANKVAPEDWIVFWVFNDYSSYKKVRDNLSKTPIEKCSDFNNAPKFVGRIESITMGKSADANGKFEVFYTVNCSGFSELDDNIYFDQLLDHLQGNASLWWSDFSNAQEQISVGGLIKATEAIIFLLKICLGLGPGGNAIGTSFGASVVASPNKAFLIPKKVVEILLGQSAPPPFKGNDYSYVDLLRVIIGVQQYDGKGFLPKIKINKDGILETDVPLTGTFNLPPLDFNNIPVWSILMGFVLVPVNEMYTCLRVNEKGEVMPTLVVRQLPFSTRVFSDNNKKTTPFLDLPRWDIDLSLVTSISVTKSNALRYNYVHILPVDFGITAQFREAYARYTSNPIVNEADIQRAGLRAAIKNFGTANGANDEELKNSSSFWSRLVADTLFDAHLKTTGTITIKGIQEPICQGDNCMVDGNIYHIEQVIHTGGIDNNGKKEFTTQLHVSNGISALSDENNRDIYSGFDNANGAVEDLVDFGYDVEEG